MLHHLYLHLHDIGLFALIGFLGQMVDGSIGMAYGLVSSTVMLSMGIPPALASASVHTAEIFTTAASGFSHWRLKNVDKRLFRALALPGMVGGMTGALVLSHVSAKIKPLVMGCVILWKAFKKKRARAEPPKQVVLLGLSGGFLGAVGGGGWGPIVTSTLLGSGTEPRIAIGSTNLAEFFVDAVTAAAFLMMIPVGSLWPMILGLILGGIVASPLAALVTKFLPPRPLMVIVGLLVVGLSAHGLYQMLHLKTHAVTESGE